MKRRIVKGKLDQLDIARNQTVDIETFFLGTLERQDRTPTEEAQWLSAAERMLQHWEPYLQRTQERFDKYGESGVEVVG